ncbi:DNA-binding transcriptional regulator, MerR family [Halobacillus karajensis]|uniref:Copper export regulator n=1 Tax=Halobacillus karajensis TaxID=195088 RepID=A0A059NXZ0_9BACI|nr:MerR family transcriptional regulator [Halobacillus karajensis]CDQ19250.1 Copper export regulator [Halobacillus karajensis]CDQ22676.1 Copper export regulator [Halobacillus karajensis]CDQ26158.1 Copper export regulator [Halobacillus karajensis]SEH39408.1 DNA-binding transcriptional regulator, MerR family [Halobacillus karajensis]
MTERLSIQKVAEKFEVTQRTIRYYEERGLIKPSRNSGGHRSFSPKDVTRLGLVFRGKKYGFQLDEIKEMIHLFDQDPSGVRQLERTLDYGHEKLREVDDRIHELQELRAEMRQWLVKFEEELRERRGDPV